MRDDLNIGHIGDVKERPRHQPCTTWNITELLLPIITIMVRPQLHTMCCYHDQQDVSIHSVNCHNHTQECDMADVNDVTDIEDKSKKTVLVE